MGARSCRDVRYGYKLFNGPDRKTLLGGERCKAGAPAEAQASSASMAPARSGVV